MVSRILTIFVILLSFVLLTSCAPTQFIPKEPPTIKFDPTPKYKTDLSDIIQPPKPIHIWVDEKFQKVDDPAKAKYLVLTHDEYAKYVAQLKIKKTYEEIINEQEILINTYVDIINSLKELVALEQAKAKAYRDLWADSENAYRQERYDHQIDNLTNRGIIGAISIGAIVIAILAL
jgi:hypothetical protein